MHRSTWAETDETWTRLIRLGWKNAALMTFISSKIHLHLINLQKLILERVMKAFILIVSIFFFSSSSAHESREYGFAMTTNNECENYDEAITIFKELNTYIETNTPLYIYAMWHEFTRPAGVSCND